MTTIEAGLPRPVADAYPDEQLALDLRWWAAANYLTAAQIYLRDNPLLREPLPRASTSSRGCSGHWGTSPGLSMLLHAAQPADPPHRPRAASTSPARATAARPWWPAPTWTAPTARSTPHVSADLAGLHRLVRQFSTPGGITQPRERADRRAASTRAASSATRWLHAAGAAFDHPDLLVACVVGDGEAETGPLAASWRLPAFLDPQRDGAVLPVLHLNGYKISGPTVLGRTADDDVVRASSPARAGTRSSSPATSRPTVFRRLDAALAAAHGDDHASCRRRARAGAGRPAGALAGDRAAHAQGLDRAATIVDGVPVEGTAAPTRCRWRRCGRTPEHLRAARASGCAPTARSRPSTRDGRLVPELAALSPHGDLRMSASP